MKFDNFFSANNFAVDYNRSLEAWEHNTAIPVYLTETQEWVVLKEIDSYGTFDHPTVDLEGDEVVLSAGWLDPLTGETSLERCLGKAACGFCDGTCPGCRHDSQYEEWVEIWYF